MDGLCLAVEHGECFGKLNNDKDNLHSFEELCKCVMSIFLQDFLESMALEKLQHLRLGSNKLLTYRDIRGEKNLILTPVYLPF